MNPSQLVIILSCANMLLTYFYLNKLKSIWPNNKWTASEQNPIIRMCVEKFGLEPGMVYSSFIVVGLVTGVTYFISNNLRWFLAGFLTMGIMIHYLNFIALYRLAMQKKIKTK